LEYERIEVKKLLGRRYRFYPEDGKDEGADGGADTGGFGDCVGWDGWPEKWPKTVEEISTVEEIPTMVKPVGVVSFIQMLYSLAFSWAFW